MPRYGHWPEHTGELLLAEKLVGLDDGKLHLWFNIDLYQVNNIDIILWDELTGLFCIEVKAIPMSCIEEYSRREIKIVDRYPSKEPTIQALACLRGLSTFLRPKMTLVPWIVSTVSWPVIARSEWSDSQLEDVIPAAGLLFTDDFVDIDALRSRLRVIAKNPPRGKASFADPFDYKQFESFVTAIDRNVVLEKGPIAPALIAPAPVVEVKKPEVVVKPATPTVKATLELVQPAGKKTRSFPLHSPCIVGRKSTPDAAVDIDLSEIEDSEFISRQHARFAYENGIWTLENLSNSNGTYILAKDFEPLIKAAVRDGDTLVFGRSRFVFRTQYSPNRRVMAAR